MKFPFTHPTRAMLPTSKPALSTTGTFWRRLIPLAVCLTSVSVLPAAAQFTDIAAGLTGARNTVAWGDYDNDGDLDLLSTGALAGGVTGFADIYDNSGGTFTGLGAGLPQVLNGVNNGKDAAAWGDFDRDGDLDVAIVGTDGSVAHADIYENSGGSFSLVTLGGTGLTPLVSGSVAWGDYDNDGDLDLFMTGTTTSGACLTTIYRNDGGSPWAFTDITPAFIPVSDGAGAFGDYDNDGDLDLVVSGFACSIGKPLTQLYINNAGVFAPSGIPLLGVRYSALAWGDYDNDGDLDLAVSGNTGGVATQSKLYQNTGTTLLATTITIPAIANGSLAWGDYDNDGDLDLLAVGTGSSTIAEVYANSGGGPYTFTGISAGLTPVYNGQAVWGDFDNDGKLDIALCGYDPSSATPITSIYRNSSANIPANNTPNAPSTLSLSASWHSITATWGGASDAETPTANLHYNLRVLDVTTGATVVSPMSDVSSGYRRIAALGNTDHDLSWTITNLTPGHTYSVCVQSIDGALAGSPFTCANDVTLDASGPDIAIFDCPAESGAEPDVTCGVVYNSQDIWVRNTIGSGFTNFTMQNPIYGQPNYIYVRMTNIGATALPAGRVYVYWAKYAVGGQGWSWDWINAHDGAGHLVGDLAGYADISGLSAGGSTIVEIEWLNPPNPADFGVGSVHGCLLARFWAPEDPLTFGEVTNAQVNTRNNNNIGWRNFDAIKGSPSTSTTSYADFGNPFNTQAQFDLAFGEEQGNASLLNNGSIVVDLGPTLFNRWVNAGAHGNGIAVHSNNANNTKIDIRSANATIENLAMNARERFTLAITYSTSYNSELSGHVFTWNITTALSGGGDIVGGATNEITMPSSPQGKPARSISEELSEMYGLTVHPNPANTSTTISYLLPRDEQVSVEIHDAAGNLVRVLVPSLAQARGAHDVVWNGLDDRGARVPAGTYFYRLVTGVGTTEGQVKIVR